MKAVIGDICFPKSETIIIPSNTKGVMSRGVSARVLKAGLSGISKEVHKYLESNTVEEGGCFYSGPGRLNRRGLKRIYYAITKRLQSDFSSIYLINKALKNTLKEVVSDGYSSVAICGLGDGNLDEKTIARITVENCNRYDNSINITIIDDNKDFIKEVNVFLKEYNNVNNE